MTVTLAKWTLTDYHQMIEAGILQERRVELLRGEIVEMAPEGEPHAYCSDEAGEYLARLLGDRAKVRQAKPITLPNASEPEPDLAIVQRLGREYRSHHPYPENIFWVVEYANASLTKDLNIKSDVYAEVGIPEYWVVNLKTLELVVFRVPQDGKYRSQQMFTSGIIQPVAFPDVNVLVDAIVMTTVMTEDIG
ncbi:MAG: Uma2 family endonuclease [Elainella sp.]